MNSSEDIARFVASCRPRLRSLRDPEAMLALQAWPSFASYAPEEFAPASWPFAVRRIWQTICLAVYEGGQGCVFVPNNLLSLVGEVPRFTEAVTGVEATRLEDVAIVRGYALCSAIATRRIPSSMSARSIALVVSRAGDVPMPLLVPVFDADDAESFRRLSERAHRVGNLYAGARDEWVQPARVRMHDIHEPEGYGPTSDRSAVRFREQIVERLDRLLPPWFPAPLFGPPVRRTTDHDPVASSTRNE